MLILSGVPEEAITENDLLGTKTRTLALPLVHESDIKIVSVLLQQTPASIAPQSVLQVLLAHAAEVDRHARESVASAEMHGLLRQAIASNTVGVDRQLLTRAFDAGRAAGRAGTCRPPSRPGDRARDDGAAGRRQRDPL